MNKWRWCRRGIIAPWHKLNTVWILGLERRFVNQSLTGTEKTYTFLSGGGGGGGAEEESGEKERGDEWEHIIIKLPRVGGAK